MDKDKLHTIKSTGFKTPKHYFETFEDELFSKLSEEKAISGIESTGYTVPKDYFSDVDDRILSQLDNESKPVIQVSFAHYVLLYSWCCGKCSSNGQLIF